MMTLEDFLESQGVAKLAPPNKTAAADVSTPKKSIKGRAASSYDLVVEGEGDQNSLPIGVDLTDQLVRSSSKAALVSDSGVQEVSDGEAGEEEGDFQEDEPAGSQHIDPPSVFMYWTRVCARFTHARMATCKVGVN